MPYEQSWDTIWHEPDNLSQLWTARFPRRLFLGGVLGTVGLSAISCDTFRQQPPVQPQTSFAAYHNRSASYHQQQIVSLTKQGYRPISLSLYGDVAQPLYAAIWIQHSGNAWYTFHTLPAAQLQPLIDSWTQRGYRLTVLTAIGTQANTIFAGVFEHDSTPSLVKYHLLTTAQDNIIDNPPPPTQTTTIQYWQHWAMDNNYILRWGAWYGDAAHPLYAGIWEKNSSSVSWNWFSAFSESSQLFQQRLQAEAEQWVRPAFITLSPDRQVWSSFHDDIIGPWLAYNNLTTSDYEAQLAHNKQKSYYPFMVQGSRTAQDTRFAAIFVQRGQPISRQWTVTGPALPAFSSFDTIMQHYMQNYAIRGSSLAIARQGKLVFARSYTWSEPDYPVTQPTSLFRTASCTKPFTSIGIHQLIEHGSLDLNTPIQDILQIKTADGHAPRDPRFKQIRIWHLLSHAGGWDRGATFDPLFNDAAIAQELKIPLPITKYQMTTFMANQPLQFAPGTKAIYSNFGYSLLGQIIEKITGYNYQQALQENVYKLLGLSRPRLGQSLLTQRAPGEVRYHGRYPFITQSVMSPDQPIVPGPYGGFNQQIADSLGGQILAACDYVRMLAAFDLGEANPLLRPTTVDMMWTEPQALVGTNILRGWFRGVLAHGLIAIGHNGDDLGTATMAFRRSDNTSFVVFFNHDFGTSLYIDGTGNMLSNALSDAADAIARADWPEHDLFPAVGIPSFLL